VTTTKFASMLETFGAKFVG